MSDFLYYLGLCTFMFSCSLLGWAFGPPIVRYLLKWWQKRGGDVAGMCFVAFVLAMLLTTLIITNRP